MVFLLKAWFNLIYIADPMANVSSWSVEEEEKSISGLEEEEPSSSSVSAGATDTTSNGSSIAAVTNPFDSYLLESLHEHTYSPSVFKNVISPGREVSRPLQLNFFLWEPNLLLPPKKLLRAGGG